MKYRWYQFDPLKSFLSLPILWVTIGIFVLLALGVAGVIIVESNLQLSFDYLGINQFVSIFKVPLGILALIIPIVALLASNHRSEQTRAQIESSKEQNLFSNFYTHAEEFQKFIISLQLDNEPEFFNERDLHKVLFPRAIKGDYSIDPNILVNVNSVIHQIEKLLLNFRDGHPSSEMDTIFSIQQSIYNLYSILAINLRHKTPRNYIVDGNIIVGPKADLRVYLSYLRTRISILNKIFSFDHNYSPSLSTIKLSYMKYQNAPLHEFLESDIPSTPFDLFS